MARSPPLGKEDASGSPLMSSLPENSMMTLPSGEGEIKLSCFSAVMPVRGWNQWVKWVAPWATAQTFIAWATALATPMSSSFPSSMVLRREAYTSAERVARMTRSSNTRLPKISDTLLIFKTPFSQILRARSRNGKGVFRVNTKDAFAFS